MLDLTLIDDPSHKVLVNVDYIGIFPNNPSNGPCGPMTHTRNMSTVEEKMNSIMLAINYLT